LDQLDHSGGGDEETLLLDLTSTFGAVDADGDAVTLEADSITDSVENDVPANISPTAAAVANSATGLATAPLDSYGNVGADEAGSIVFFGTDGSALTGTKGDGPTVVALTSAGHAILLSGFGTDTLSGFVDENDNGVIDEGEFKILEISLNPDGTDASSDTYMVQLFGSLDNGQSFSFDDFSDAPAGLNDFIGIDDPREPDLDQDLLFTGGDPGVQEVNTSDFGVGVDAQNIDTNLTLRLDYVTGVNRSDGTEGSSSGDSKDITRTFFDEHYFVNNSSFTIIQTGANSLNRVDAWVQVYDSLDSDDGDPNTPYDPTEFLNDPLDTITRIQVYDGSGVLLEDTADLGNYDDANIVVTFDPFGATNTGVLVEGLLEDYEVFVTTADGYSRMEITNLTTNGDLGYLDDPTDSKDAYIDFSDPTNPFVVNPDANDNFDLGGFEVSTSNAGEPINMSFDLSVTDEDGDTSTGILQVTALPEIIGSEGVDLLTGTDNAEFIIGGNSNDTLTGLGGDDQLSGGSGADTFVFSLGGDFGDDFLLDFDGSEDILSFVDVLDSEPDADFDIADVDAVIDGFINEGAGGDVTVNFDTGASITFVGAGSDSLIDSIADLVNDANSQVMVS
jgi:hypothetical protein